MDLYELEPQKKGLSLKNLEIMSVEALIEYVVKLEDEIERVKKAISLKKSAREGADSFFKK